MIENRDLLTPEQRKVMINKIIDYFAVERDQQLGIIAAEDILDEFLEIAGNDLYNKGVIETKKLVQDQLQSLNFEIDLLLKEIRE